MKRSLCRQGRLVFPIRHRQDERKLIHYAENLGFFLRGDPGQDEGEIVGVRVLVTLDDQLLHPGRASGKRLLNGRDRGLAPPGQATEPRDVALGSLKFARRIRNGWMLRGRRAALGETPVA
jgi:hypothetical protein